MKTILVTGDHSPDYDIYLHSDEDNPPPEAPPTKLRATVGGAGLTERVLREVAQHDNGRAASLEVLFVAGEIAAAPPIAAIWRPAPLGGFANHPAEEKLPVWRAKRSLSLGRVDDPSLPHRPALPQNADSFQADILVIEDNADGFRFALPAKLKTFLQSPPDQLPELIVLKTRAPVCHGELWWTLAGLDTVVDRLAVIVPVKDLRRADIRVSQGISWERTAEDLIRELTNNAALAGLRRARHVLVTLQGEGVLWMERVPAKEGRLGFRLFFDPAHMEGEWAEKVSKAGGAYGYHSVFAAAIAARGALATQCADEDPIATGIKRGILAMRALRVLGHGPVEAEKPGLPVAELGELLAAGNLADVIKSPNTKLAWKKFSAIGSVKIPADLAPGSRWRILEATSTAGMSSPAHSIPLYGKARRVALFGLRQLDNVPYARFGKYFTADRDEIEALRNLKRLIQGYDADKRETKPLSLAVFGPPGAGKSFGIKQITETVVDEKERAFLEFNLSQFNDSVDLIGAFHQVRDKVLEGKLPVVFWDEFDSQNYKWLQYLLAPMQDGKFQEGQITHPIGRCVFVFAGATSYTCENFGPPKDPSSAETEEGRKARADYKLKKGPDFISRLHGTLDVLGPNPRQQFKAGNWQDDPTDVCFPVRRAILLRSLLGLMDEKHGRDRLDMDSGLLAALLETGHYKYGSRSFEKIVLCLKHDARHGHHRSGLPTDEVLTMNIEDLNEFKELLDESGHFQKFADKLAPAVHAAWFPIADQENAYRTGFSDLPSEGQGDNHAAVARIPHLLGLVGLRLVKAEDSQAACEHAKGILEEHLELLAEEEHDLWMELKLANGWKLPAAKPRDKAERAQQRVLRLHDCLVPYASLLQEERQKDHTSILNIPEVARLGGFKIILRQRIT